MKEHDQTFTVKVRKVYETDLLVDADTQHEAEETIETMMESQSLDTYEDFEGVYDFGYEEVVPSAKEDEGYNDKLELLSAYAYTIGLQLDYVSQQGLTVETYISPHDFD